MSYATWMAVLLPAATAFAVIAFLRVSPWTTPLADHPNGRSLHADPTPRIGGLGFIAAVFPFALAHAHADLGVVFACALALALVSLVDDVRSLPIEVRLPAHGVAALVAVLAMGPPPFVPLPWAGIGIAVAVCVVAWFTNLFNFMDGSDGLAGGMAAIGFGVYAIAAGSQAASLALLCIALASASVGFLAHNFPPARVFLGDCGSIPLGFLSGALGLYGAGVAVWPWWFPLLVFSPFIVDATATLLLRIARRERFWTAHRGHAYQRLVLSGWTRPRLAVFAYLLMTAAGASALLARAQGAEIQCAIIFAWAAIYALLAVAVNRRTRRSRNPS